jgi:nucleotide-binding universal stress UspA family protein
MKDLIIVGIDFSQGSLNALNLAVTIANKVNANVMMVWVDKPQREDSIYSDADNEPRMEAQRRLDALVEEFSAKLIRGKILYKIRNGKVYRELVNQAKYHDAWLVITGTHGTSGFEEFWIGSNAYKVVTYSPCPVITIRYASDAKKIIRTIVLPIDSTIQTRQKVPFTVDLAKVFRAEVHVLSIYSSSVKYLRNLVDSYAKQVVEHLEEEGIKYVQASRDVDNLTDGIIEYATEVNADLISIMTEQETKTKNLLLGAYAQQMVNHSPFPVLCIHAKSIYDKQTK